MSVAGSVVSSRRQTDMSASQAIFYHSESMSDVGRIAPPPPPPPPVQITSQESFAVVDGGVHYSNVEKPDDRAIQEIVGLLKASPCHLQPTCV